MINPKQDYQNIRSERGSAFFYILLGVVLFGTLAFTVSRGMRGQQTSAMSERQAELAVSELLDYAQKIEHTVNRLRRNGCSENEISFDNSFAAGYSNANSPVDNSCHIFHQNGGGINYKTPNGNSLDQSQQGVGIHYGVYQFHGLSQVENVGTDCGLTNCTELTVMVLNLKESLCRKINEKMIGTSTISTDSVTNFDQVGPNDFFKGGFLLYQYREYFRRCPFKFIWAKDRLFCTYF